MNVLVSSAGRRVELVNMMRSAAGGRVVAVDADATAPALYHADEAERVPPIVSNEFIETVLNVCKQHSVGLVIPTIDTELAKYAAAATEFATSGIGVAIAGIPAVTSCLDKLDAAAILGRAQLNAVPTESWRAGDCPFPFPVVVKPRKGASARGFRVVQDAATWTAPDQSEEWVVQPFINGIEITVDCIANDEGSILGLGCRQRLKVRGGEVERARTVEARDYLDLACGIAVAFALHGPFNFQILWQNGVPWICEVNPRLGGGAPLSQVAGARLLDLLCEWASNGSWPNRPPALAEAGRYMLRSDASDFRRHDELLWQQD